MKKIVKVEGMMCPHCEGRVKEAFENNAKVESAIAFHEKKMVELSLKEDMTVDEAKAIVEGAGYKFLGIEQFKKNIYMVLFTQILRFAIYPIVNLQTRYFCCNLIVVLLE